MIARDKNGRSRAKLGCLLLFLGAIALIVVWFANDGFLKFLDRNLKRGFEESAAKKIRIYKSFRGSWRLVGEIDRAGRRHSPDKPHILSITAKEMSKRRVDQSDEPTSTTTIHIGDDGSVWWDNPHEMGDRRKIAKLRVEGDELHVVDFRAGAHNVYVRTESPQ